MPISKRSSGAMPPASGASTGPNNPTTNPHIRTPTMLDQPPANSNPLRKLFAVNKPIIGMVHVKPLPGSPRAKAVDIEAVYDAAVEEALRLVGGGVDGLLLENAGDIPFLKPEDIGYETVGAMSIVGDRPLSEQTRDVEFFGADVLIATGNRTGHAAEVEEIEGIREGATRPILVGSGITPDTAESLLTAADGAIVGSWFKDTNNMWGVVVPDKVARLMEKVQRFR